jgi:hypothetical protein
MSIPIWLPEASVTPESHRALNRRSSFGRPLALLASLLIASVATSLLRAQNPAPAPPTPNTVPQGTTFLIQLTDRLDTRAVKAGDRFHARLAENLISANGAVLPEGRKIKGHVSALEPGFRTRLLLSFDEIETERGWVPLIATVTGVPGEHGLKQTGEEGEIERRGMDKERIAEAVVVGASEGAAQGAQSGGKRGVAAGAGNGAADSALSAFESGHNLVLDKGTALELRLDRSLQIPSR